MNFHHLARTERITATKSAANSRFLYDELVHEEAVPTEHARFPASSWLVPQDILHSVRVLMKVWGLSTTDCAMSIPETPPRYCVYLLRCWEERPEGPDSEVAWRFVIEMVESGERHGFSSMEKMSAFLRHSLLGYHKPDYRKFVNMQEQGD